MKLSLRFAILTCTVFTVHAQQSTTDAGCSGHEIDQAVANSNFDDALAIDQKCIDEKTADLVLTERKYAGKRSDFINVVGLTEVTTGAFVIAKAQILILKGAFSQASAALADAEKFDKQYDQAAMDWSITGSQLSVARALLSEKSGDLKGAAAAYEAIIAEEKKKGWENNSDVVHGRLALVELQRGNDSEAERWAKENLSEDPGANVAMAMLAKKRGDQVNATKYYKTALKLMDEKLKDNSWSIPLVFAEYQRARAGAGK
jgi:tetratricopeptide (TPR) repeat protein